MIKKILISVLAFLLTIFPHSNNLLGQYQTLQFIGVKNINNIIVNAINEKDVDAIYDLFCPYYKDNVDELHEKISEFIDSIDGKIVDFYSSGSSEGSYSNKGYSYHRKAWEIYIRTDTYDGSVEGKKYNYSIPLSWYISNTKDPDMVGMTYLSLFDKINFNEEGIYIIYYA